MQLLMQCCADQAEFNMTLPDVGVLQSAALIGYLFGQVTVCSMGRSAS